MRLIHVITSPNSNVRYNHLRTEPFLRSSLSRVSRPTPSPTASSSAPAPSSAATAISSGDVLICDTRLLAVTNIARARKAAAYL
ncbi:unnamed protein product [Rhizoctonia solani]|uniref:Uncharacterized protein n=1 Tax=Rhizoctonia solani TaxID=456999 RepID=A0A8H3HGU2_9AGAM|nr:unnamed protein product [Rhizoctonia solani]